VIFVFVVPGAPTRRGSNRDHLVVLGQGNIAHRLEVTFRVKVSSTYLTNVVLPSSSVPVDFLEDFLLGYTFAFWICRPGPAAVERAPDIAVVDIVSVSRLAPVRREVQSHRQKISFDEAPVRPGIQSGSVQV
jgi:hypothetical protein